jgi:hypothetical protein
VVAPQLLSAEDEVTAYDNFEQGPRAAVDERMQLVVGE